MLYFRFAVTKCQYSTSQHQILPHRKTFRNTHKCDHKAPVFRKYNRFCICCVQSERLNTLEALVRKRCLFFPSWLSAVVDVWFNNLCTNRWTDDRLCKFLRLVTVCSANRFSEMSVKLEDICEKKRERIGEECETQW